MAPLKGADTIDIIKGADTIDITKSADTVDVIKAKYAAREKQMIESVQPESSPITPETVAEGACKRKSCVHH